MEYVARVDGQQNVSIYVTVKVNYREMCTHFGQYTHCKLNLSNSRQSNFNSFSKFTGRLESTPFFRDVVNN